MKEFALECGIVKYWNLLLPLSLLFSACQTTDDASVTNTWNSVPSARLSDAQVRPERISGAPLLDNTRGGKSTVIEGTGRFVGDPPTGSVRWSGDPGDDGVTEAA